MSLSMQHRTCCLLAMASLVIAIPMNSSVHADQKPMVYWCPDRPADQQYSATQEAGCVPVVSEEAKERNRRHNGTPEREIQLENLQSEVERFLQQYNQFINCCAADPAYLKQLHSLERQASVLLKAVREDLPTSQIKLRGVAFASMLEPLSRARYDLARLKQRLKDLRQAKRRLPRLGYEEAGRERRKIELEQEAIKREFRPLTLPSTGQTGTAIQDTSLPTRFGETAGETSLPTGTGEKIEGLVSPESGERIDLHPRTGSDVGVTPPTGPDIGQTPAKGFAIGTEEGPTGSSSLPTRAGPSIGDSSLNQP